MIISKNLPSIDDIKKNLSPLFQEKELQLALLFGSIVRGGTHSYSDIDLAFLYDTPIDVISLTTEVIKLLHTDRVDVIDLSRATPLLRFSVVRHGRLLYERSPGLFNTFSSLAFRRYVDTKKLRAAGQRAVESFLQQKGLI